jgi:hypothetical protein
MAKTDLKKELRDLYFPSAKEVALVDVPPMNFLMIDGSGDPNTAPAFKESIEALYGVSYTLKFILKKSGLGDHMVLPLEGLWWTDAMGRFSIDARDEWTWTSMIAQPKPVTRELVRRAVAQLEEKKHPPALPRMRFERFREGRSVQIMHIGPYAAEGPTIEKLHAYVRDHGYELAGKHHEIYLGDPRRTDPKKLKTVLRQPVR